MGLFRRLYNRMYPPPPEPELGDDIMPRQDGWPAPPGGWVRQDGWQNPYTGIGTARDKSMAGYFTPKFQLAPNELIAMFNASDLARKIVMKPAVEMFRRGYDIKATVTATDDEDDTDAKEDPAPAGAAGLPPNGKPAPIAAPKVSAPGAAQAMLPVGPPPKVAPETSDADGPDEDEVDPKQQKKLETKLQDLQVNRAMKWGKIWGRLFGGALVIMGAMDGQTPEKPLNEDNLQSFECLNVVDRRYVWVQRYYSDPLSPKYGMPELYLVTNMISGAGLTVGGMPSGTQATSVIHETRVIRFDGNETDDITRQQLAGWSFSVLQTVYDTMKKFEHAFDGAAALLADVAQGILKLQGVIDAISSGDSSDLQARVAAWDMSRSSIKVGILDSEAGETFERVTTQLAGIADILDRWMSRLCAAADMPKSELFGESPGGLNANSEGETRKWYDMIASLQTEELGPQLKRVVNLISKAADSPIDPDLRDRVEWEICFRPLWAPTDKEDAEYRFTIAQADQIYYNIGVATPAQIALGRFGGNKFSPDIKVDVKALQASVSGKVMADPYGNTESQDPSIQVNPATGQTPGPQTRTSVLTGPGNAQIPTGAPGHAMVPTKKPGEDD